MSVHDLLWVRSIYRTFQFIQCIDQTQHPVDRGVPLRYDGHVVDWPGQRSGHLLKGLHGLHQGAEGDTAEDVTRCDD